MRPLLAAFAAVLLVGCRAVHVDSPPMPPEEGGKGMHQIQGFFHVAQHSEVTCGAAVVAGVLSYWGTPSTSDEVAKATLKPGAEGIVAGDLQAYVESKGYVGLIFEGSLSKVMEHIDKGRPVIVGTANVDGTFHYLTLTGYHDQRGYFAADDPSRGLRKMSFDELVRIWGPARWFTFLIAPRPKAPVEKTATSR